MDNVWTHCLQLRDNLTLPPRLKDLDELRTFVQIIESGSLTAAGRVMGIPTNVVSRRLAKLEQRLGVPLAQRTTRRFRATEEGRRLHQRGRRILAEVDAAETEMMHIDAGLAGELRVSLPTLIADQVRKPMRALMARHPQLSLRLFVTDRPADLVIGDIIESGLDAAVLIGPLPDREIVAPLLGRLTPALAASRSYAKQHGLPRNVTELGEHECLLFIGKQLQDEWRLVDEDGQEIAVSVHGSFASSDSRVLRDALFDGIGIGLIMPGEMASRDLVQVLPGLRFAAIDVRLGYASARRGSRRVFTLVEVLGTALHNIATEGANRVPGARSTTLS